MFSTLPPHVPPQCPFCGVNMLWHQRNSMSPSGTAVAMFEWTCTEHGAPEVISHPD